MSSTPKVTPLSAKQLNKTISAKKKPAKTIKNILSSKSLEWSVLDDSKALFDELLNIGITAMKEGTPKSEIKTNLRKLIFFGVNQIGKCIKREECSAVLFNADTPKLLISHLVHLAKDKNIPFLIIRGLENFLLENLGFKSSSICFKSECNNFIKLLQIINKHTNYEKKMVSRTVTNVTPEIAYNPSSEIICKAKSAVVYLKKPQDGTRAFNPPSSKATTNIDKRPKAVAESFIKFRENRPKSTNKKLFKPLYVKRIQSNGNRNRKKETNKSQ